MGFFQEEKRGNFSVAVLKCAIDAENAEARIQDLTSKVSLLFLMDIHNSQHSIIVLANLG